LGNCGPAEVDLGGFLSCRVEPGDPVRIAITSAAD
jgi:hypothetical protein